MLDIGWTELLVIAIILIVVVGPKDLPPMLRAFGKMTSNLRRMAGEFRTQFDEALRESELDEVRKTIADAKSLNPASNLRDALNPLRQMGEEIKSDLRSAATPPAKPKDSAPPAPPATGNVPAAPPAEASPPVPVEVPPAEAAAAAPAAEPPARPKAARKPRAAAKPRRKTAAKADDTGAAPVKKTAPRKKKTTEPGKDEA